MSSLSYWHVLHGTTGLPPNVKKKKKITHTLHNLQNMRSWWLPKTECVHSIFIWHLYNTAWRIWFCAIIKHPCIPREEIVTYSGPQFLY